MFITTKAHFKPTKFKMRVYRVCPFGNSVTFRSVENTTFKFTNRKQNYKKKP